MNFLRISSALKEQYFFWSTREASGFRTYIYIYISVLHRQIYCSLHDRFAIHKFELII